MRMLFFRSAEMVRISSSVSEKSNTSRFSEMCCSSSARGTAATTGCWTSQRKQICSCVFPCFLAILPMTGSLISFPDHAMALECRDHSVLRQIGMVLDLVGDQRFGADTHRLVEHGKCEI